MANDEPTWYDALGEADQPFLKRFLLASGSLKDLAADYGISYPTVRARLDRVIEKVKAFDASTNDDPFERTVRMMVRDLKMTPETGRDVIKAYKAAKKKS